MHLFPSLFYRYSCSRPKASMASNPSAADAGGATSADASQHANDSSAAPLTTSSGKTDGTATKEKPALEPSLPITAESKEKTSAQADDDVNPPDFQGEVLTNNELPSPETIRRIGDYIVLDRHGKTHTFKSLYTGRNVARRVLIIFVRHFFCGVSFIIFYVTGSFHLYLAKRHVTHLLCLIRTAKNTFAPSPPRSTLSPSWACRSAPSSQ